MQLFAMPIDYVFFISLIGFVIFWNPIGEGRELGKARNKVARF